MTAADLLRKENKARLVKAIGTAEKNTSGEIRVHLEQVCKGDPYLRAAYVFSRLGMFNTKDRNGVLIYMAMKSHKFAIVGDSGINARVYQKDDVNELPDEISYEDNQNDS